MTVIAVLSMHHDAISGSVNIRIDRTGDIDPVMEARRAERPGGAITVKGGNSPLGNSMTEGIRRR